MTDDADFKRLVRARMTEAGESYTEARAALRPAQAGSGPEGHTPVSQLTPVTLETARIDRFRAPGELPAGHEGPWWIVLEPFVFRPELTEPPELGALRQMAQEAGALAVLTCGMTCPVPVEGDLNDSETRQAFGRGLFEWMQGSGPTELRAAVRAALPPALVETRTGLDGPSWLGGFRSEGGPHTVTDVGFRRVVHPGDPPVDAASVAAVASGFDGARPLYRPGLAVRAEGRLSTGPVGDLSGKESPFRVLNLHGFDPDDDGPLAALLGATVRRFRQDWPGARFAMAPVYAEA